MAKYLTVMVMSSNHVLHELASIISYFSVSKNNLSMIYDNGSGIMIMDLGL